MTTPTILPSPSGLPRVALRAFAGTLDKATEWAAKLGAETVYYIPTNHTAYILADLVPATDAAHKHNPDPLGFRVPTRIEVIPEE